LTGKYFHLAGIISLLGESSRFGMDWHDCLMPIAPNFTMIDKAVLECALAGCETIWIVCDDDVTPLLRYRLGDWVEDPVYQHRKTPQHYNYKKEIPIFYVPTHPDDMGRRDSEAWGILSGAHRARSVSGQISKWTTPGAYFVSFPGGISNLSLLRESRAILSSDQGFCLSFGTPPVTFADGERLSFTFHSHTLDALIKHFKANNVNLFRDGKKLPLDKRYSGRYFSLQKTFECIDIGQYCVKKTTFYHNIGDWGGYRDYIVSGDTAMFERPSGDILKFREFDRIPEGE